MSVWAEPDETPPSTHAPYIAGNVS
jgi:hypothetical protein